jgi:cytochrome P450
MTSVKGYEPAVDETINVIKAHFNKAAESQETVDLAVLLKSYAFDVVSCITFGHSFGALDETKDSSELFKAIDQRLAYSTFVGFFPSIHPYIYPQVVKRTAGSFVYKFCSSHIASIRDALRLGKATSPINGQPFIARLIEKQNDAPKQITSGDIYATALSNVFAGSDTTATSLSGVLYYLIRTPRVLAKLRQELDEARAQGKVSTPISFDESQDLPYLQACLKEGMRLHHAGALPLNREVPAPGWKVGDHFVPEGSVIGIAARELHQNKEIYGEDAAIFRPERWLEFAKVEGKVAEVETCYVTFGRGSRGCIGKNIAMIEIEKLVPELVQNFDFEVPDWSKVEREGGGLRTRGWSLAKVMSFESKVKRRECDMKLVQSIS